MFNINFVLDQNLQLLQIRAKEKKINLLLERSDDVYVYADEPTTDIVTRNLIENAIKFSNAGDTITVHAKVNNTNAIISVIDNGKGIPYEDQGKIFNRLSTYTTFGTSKEKGSGLGLLLCKELIENNKGKIWFTSEPGKGSTFSFSLPIKNNKTDFINNYQSPKVAPCVAAQM